MKAFKVNRHNLQIPVSFETDKQFSFLIMDSPLLQDQATDLDTMVDQYDRVLRQLLDQHAPKKKRQVTVRPSAPWYTSDVVAEKRKRRRLERRWRASRLQCDRDQYVRQCCVVNNLIATLKSAHYTSVINEHSSVLCIRTQTPSR